jgi:hypothetical protein
MVCPCTADATVKAAGCAGSPQAPGVSHDTPGPGSGHLPCNDLWTRIVTWGAGL